MKMISIFLKKFILSIDWRTAIDLSINSFSVTDHSKLKKFYVA